MARAAFLRASALALLFLPWATQPLEAGLIIFGGDLAGALSSPVSTPATLSAGAMPTFHFDSGTVPGIGRVSGDVVLANSADATAGSITVTNFSFVSARPPGTGPVGFTLAVSQDFTYAGPPLVSASEALNGLYTFTALSQSGLVSLSDAVNSFVLTPFTVPGQGSGSSFPQTVPINPASPPDLGVPAATPVHLDLFLGVSLSDNAQGNGPRVDLSSAVVRYSAVVPEPGTLVLSSVGGVLTGLGYHRRRRKRAV
jgi:hypothetical protein